MKPVSIGSFAVGGGNPIALIAGPCVIESPGHAIDLALALKGIAANCDIPLVFKASFDKANRTSGTSFRGPGRSGSPAVARKPAARRSRRRR